LIKLSDTLNNMERIYECKISGFIIKCTLSENIALIEFTNFMEIMSSYNFKCFFLLLRNTVDKLKDNGIKKINFYLTNNDYIELKDKTSWKIIEGPNSFNIYIVQCDIEDILENIGVGLDIKY